MAEGADRAAWAHTAELWAAAMNANPFKRKHYTAAEVNPYGRPPDPVERVSSKEFVEILAGALTRGR